MSTIPQLMPSTAPQMTERTRRQFELREADFGKDVNGEIAHWLKRKIEALTKQYEQLHKHKVPEWRRIASGKPREENKSWPFPNCANLVHQIVGQSVDDIAARVMGLIHATSPTVYFRYFVKTADDKELYRNSEKARILEQFIDYVAEEPTELDLYAVENLWFSDSARLGTSWVVVRPEERIEAVYIGYDANNKKTEFEDTTLYQGPKVQKLRFEEVLADPNVNSLEDAELVCRITTLNRRQLHERVFKGHYRKAAVESILEHPDRYGPTESKKRENQKKGIADSDATVLAEWDVHECYFAWWNGKKKYRLMVWYHVESETVLNQVFNVIPDNQIPIVRTRLSSGEDGLLGTGYAEMLKDSQDEISTAKNQRTDAITWGILGINRMSPQNRNIDRNFQLFPGAAAPFGKDEFEHIEVGNPAMGALSLQNEQGMIQQAQERAGIGPAVAGMGTGSVSRKGVYGSMGTLAVLQDSNSRTNHRLSDFRHAHVRLIGLVTAMYGAMGTGKKGSLFGLDDALLEEALSDYLDHKVRIPIRAATASANVEVSKQNSLLYLQAMRQHHSSIAQLLQAATNPNVPENIQEWFKKVIKAQDFLMKRIARDFGFDEPSEFIPEPEERRQPLPPSVLSMSTNMQTTAVPGGTSGAPSTLLGQGEQGRPNP